MTVLADVGAGATRVVIARGCQVAFVKSIPIGGRQFNRAVADRLTLRPDEAAQLRRRIAAGEPAAPSEDAARQAQQAAYNAIRPAVEDLAGELNLCLRYYAVTFRGAKPEAVTVVGGEVHDPGLITLLGECVGIPCAGDPCAAST